MARTIPRSMGGLLLVVAIASTSPAQEGGATVAGDMLRGQGAYLHGLGWYNLSTAKASSIQVDAMIRWKAELRKIQRERWESEARQKAANKLKQEEIRQHLLERERQLRTYPTSDDVQSGAALNALVYDLTDPDIKSSTWLSSSVALPKGTSVKELIFRFTPQSQQGAAGTALSKGVISLSRLDIEGKWPTIMKVEELNSERSAYEKAYARIRDEILAGKLNLQSVLAMDETLDALRNKVMTSVPAERNFRTEALKFVDDLKAATRFFDAATVDYAQAILIDTKDHDATTVAELVSFMLKYRLQFATADRSPVARELYPKLYASLREQTEKLGIKPPHVPSESKISGPFLAKSVWTSEKSTLTVTERTPASFKATFESTIGFKREVSGTVNGNKVSWLAKDVRASKGGPGGDNHGTISRDEKGEKIDFIHRNDKGQTGTFTLRLKHSGSSK